MNSNSGDLYIIFVPLNNPFVNQMSIVKAIFYDPQYYDQQIVSTNISLLNSATPNNSWTSGETNQMMSYLEFNKVQPLSNDLTYCSVNYTLSITNRYNPALNVTSPGDVSVDFNIFGNNCTFNITSTNVFLVPPDYFSQIMFTLFISVLGILNLHFTVQIFQQIRVDPLLAREFSLLTLGALFIFYECISFGSTSLMSDPNDASYVFIPFICYLILGFFQILLIYISWISQLPVQPPQAEFRKQVCYLYLKIMFSLIIFLVLFSLFMYYEWFTFWFVFYIVPQIVHNFMNANKPQLVRYYIFGVLTTPFVLGLYFRGCPGNIGNLAPNLYYAIGWIFAFILQILVYYLQTEKGSRFFVPKKCVPGYYEYQKPLILKDNEEAVECPICLEKLDYDINSVDSVVDEKTLNINQDSQIEIDEEQKNIQISLQESLRQDQYLDKNQQNDSANSQQQQIMIMETPCQHKFHIICLQQQLERQLECPSCRAQLPAYYK